MPKAVVSRGFRSSSIGAGEGIRTLDPNLGKRQIAMSLGSIRFDGNSSECAGFHGVPRVSDFGSLKNPVNSSRLP